MSVPIDCYPQKWVLSRSPLDRLGIFKRISRKRGELMLAAAEMPSGFVVWEQSLGVWPPVGAAGHPGRPAPLFKPSPLSHSKITNNGANGDSGGSEASRQ